MQINNKEIENLTKDLVNIYSESEIGEETKVAEALEDYLTKNNVETIDSKEPTVNINDNIRNSYSIVRGKNIKKGEKVPTIVLIGHTDTVGIKDYECFGDEKIGLNPDELAEHEAYPESLVELVGKEDILLGRGSFDMKSGLAIEAYVMKELQKVADNLNGNIIFCATADEENESAGIMKALEFLTKIKKDENLEFIGAINADYTAPRFKGDTNKYVYVGTIGKLLVSLDCFGVHTHVGEPYKGIDSTLLASELVSEISTNSKLSDKNAGETAPPPSILYMKDSKEEYNVQTPFSTHIDVNYFTISENPEEALDKFKQLSESAFERVINKVNNSYKDYSESEGINHQGLSWKVNVLSHQELYSSVKSTFNGDLDEKLNQEFEKESKDEKDSRRLSKIKTKLLWDKYEHNDKPAIVVSFASPFYPHSFIADNEEPFVESAKQVVQETAKDNNITIQTRKFYPYISDISYLRLSSDIDGSISSLTKNMPMWGNGNKQYNIPIDKIKELGLPVINIGPYGDGAHKNTEGVVKSYSFKLVPEMIYKTIIKTLKNGK